MENHGGKTQEPDDLPPAVLHFQPKTLNQEIGTCAKSACKKFFEFPKEPN